jgi:integrase/recombinase XerC
MLGHMLGHEILTKSPEMKKPTFKVILKPNHTRADGTKSIVLRVTIKRRTIYYSLDMAVHEKYWLKPKSRVSTTHPQYYWMNQQIEKYEKKAREVINESVALEKTLSFSEFSRQFRSEKFSSSSFYDFVEAQIEKHGHTYASNTLKSYRSNLKKMKEFRSHLGFNELTLDFIYSYERYLVTELKNNKNTLSKSMAFLRTFVHQADKEGIKVENPFKNYKIKKIEGDREPLLPAQLEELDKLYYKETLSSGPQNVLRYFLFACYTGLRYQDIKDFGFKDIHVNRDKEGNNIKVISLIQHKTKQEVRIPIIKQAEKLLPSEGLDNQKVFKVLTGQQTNRHLKIIAQTCHLSRTITFHEARHTFATISLERGIPIEVVSKLLGHKDLKTTMEYLKVMDSLKIESMKKWEG